MTVKELFSVAKYSHIEVKDGGNGKVLCRHLSEKHDALMDREVSMIWTEIRPTSKSMPNYAHSIICVYVYNP